MENAPAAQAKNNNNNNSVSDNATMRSLISWRLIYGNEPPRRQTDYAAPAALIPYEKHMYLRVC